MATTTTRRRRSEDTDSIGVKIQPVFGEVREIRVPAESTVAEVLELAGLPTSTEVRVNGEGNLDSDSIVEDGDRLIVVGQGKIQNG